MSCVLAQDTYSHYMQIPLGKKVQAEYIWFAPPPPPPHTQSRTALLPPSHSHPSHH